MRTIISEKRQAKKAEMCSLGLTGKSYRRMLKKQRSEKKEEARSEQK